MFLTGSKPYEENWPQTHHEGYDLHYGDYYHDSCSGELNDYQKQNLLPEHDLASLLFKSESNETDTTTSSVCFDNFEITHPRDILALETPIKSSRVPSYQCEFASSDDMTIQQSVLQLNGQVYYYNSNDTNTDSNDEYLVTSLDDITNEEKEYQRNQNQHANYMCLNNTANESAFYSLDFTQNLTPNQEFEHFN